MSKSNFTRRGLLKTSAVAGALLIGLADASSPVHAQDAKASAAPTSSVPYVSGDPTIAEPVRLDGTWTLDTGIGDFADFSSAWVGFRVAEVLDHFGETEAIGRTPVVSGALEVSGTIIESATIEADLSAIRSDRSRRDRPIQRALQTQEFPVAIFESSAPVDLETLPVEGEAFEVTIPGTLTVHGVSQDVEIPLVVQQVGESVAVVGSLPIDFTSFGIEMPLAPIVVSVENEGSLEWQLFFTRGLEAS